MAQYVYVGNFVIAYIYLKQQTIELYIPMMNGYLIGNTRKFVTLHELSKCIVGALRLQKKQELHVGMKNYMQRKSMRRRKEFYAIRCGHILETVHWHMKFWLMPLIDQIFARWTTAYFGRSDITRLMTTFTN
ncbi:hypothetical protein NQ318_006430 [Aromia moschata]|uniref:Uncharacterized protein n=1 Tax=Aromia moschata TaxID=1265417 RepID=A0AAV8XT55_9CUCU|nr:hypothetical protein NQ318_006430 [Aromia moschata]